ncbi:MAG: hypothetical protein LBH13_10435 [Cellulomonadaceae bacterium]|jgi:hypothetical protein|nr:hypothetical protein [Cellulomonadaceae bacterium]
MDLLTTRETMKESFRTYLEKRGYKPSTVKDYAYRVDRVLNRENLTWDSLRTNITQLIPDYDSSGIHAEYGAQGNRTVINALKRFQEFADSTRVGDTRVHHVNQSHSSEPGLIQVTTPTTTITILIKERNP